VPAVIVHAVTQGSAEWGALRAGIPTSSEFHRILTPTGKASTSAEGYLHGLLAERMLGRPLQEHITLWMQRGTALEADAVQYYELQADCDTERVGFLTTDDGRIGASPDRLVGAEGLLEIKVPREAVHVGYLLKKPVSMEYYPQIQGQLWVSGRAWVDVLSFHPELPPALIRVERDEPYIAQLAAAVTTFSDYLERTAAELEERGWIKPRA